LNLNAEPQVEFLLSAVAPSPRSLFMLAYDRTIASVGNDPEQAFPNPGVSSLLQEIVHAAGTRLLVASARDANDTAKQAVRA
jgi:trehalose-6-phosphatase